MLGPALGPHSVDRCLKVTHGCRLGRGEHQAGLGRSAPSCSEQRRPQLRSLAPASVSLPLPCPAGGTAWILSGQQG